jgi:peroxiredoxin (alkyl hydroperoxide reductase subunit C)
VIDFRALFVAAIGFAVALFPALAVGEGAEKASDRFEDKIYQVGKIKPKDSTGALKVGDKAPDFSLPSISGEKVSLKQFAGKQNVVISFVPACYTPVCSEQWPRYDQAKQLFDENNAVLLGITVDNVPALHAWIKDMGGVWFQVLSDFWPHGDVARKYGVLRSSGTSERALFIVDEKGIIRYVDVHDINEPPGIEKLAEELEKLKK